MCASFVCLINVHSRTFFCYNKNRGAVSYTHLDVYKRQILIIPFIVVPMVCATIAWIFTSLNFVDKVVMTAPWTLPGPVGAYLATGGDWRAAVLNIFLIALSVILYYPFFKIYDKNLLKEEQGELTEE